MMRLLMGTFLRVRGAVVAFKIEAENDGFGESIR